MTSTLAPKKRRPGTSAAYLTTDAERNVAATAGPTPTGAVGGQDVLEADRREAETGSLAPPVVVPSTGVEDYGGIEGTVVAPEEHEILESGDEGYSEDGAAGDEGGNLGSTFGEYALAGLGPQDTSEEEALIRELMQQQQGMDVYNARAAGGRSGFASSGAQFGIEGDLRRRAAQAATQDILGVRREAEQDAFDRAARAAGISLDEARFESDAAYRQAVLDAMAAVLGGQPPVPPGEEPTPGFEGGLPGGPAPLLGKGTNQSETAAPPDPSGYETRESHDEGDLFLENYTDPDNKTWSVYRTPDGERYRVPMGG